MTAPEVEVALFDSRMQPTGGGGSSKSVWCPHDYLETPVVITGPAGLRVDKVAVSLQGTSSLARPARYACIPARGRPLTHLRLLESVQHIHRADAGATIRTHLVQGRTLPVRRRRYCVALPADAACSSCIKPSPPPPPPQAQKRAQMRSRSALDTWPSSTSPSPEAWSRRPAVSPISA